MQDGSYSRGPLSLLPDDVATSDEEYFKSPTFKIEQVGRQPLLLSSPFLPLCAA